MSPLETDAGVGGGPGDHLSVHHDAGSGHLGAVRLGLVHGDDVVDIIEVELALGEAEGTGVGGQRPSVVRWGVVSRPAQGVRDGSSNRGCEGVVGIVSVLGHPTVAAVLPGMAGGRLRPQVAGGVSPHRFEIGVAQGEQLPAEGSRAELEPL